jgi:GMP synthase-like glutamine amidotransferase
LIIVHEPGGEAEVVSRRLEHHGYELDEVVICPSVGETAGDASKLGDPADHDVIAVMGSTHSLADPRPISSWIGDEIEFLRRADGAGVPVLGVCFGGHALAAAHGGSVFRLDEPQFGWHPQSPHPSGLPGGPWMEWHFDGCEPPADAEVLVRDDWGTQVFTLRRNLAVQFHPEVSPSLVRVWIDAAGHELDEAGVDAAELVAATDAIADDAAERTGILVDWFLSTVAKR